MFIPCLMDSFMLFFLSVFPRCFCFLRFFSFLWRTSFWIRRKECCQITRMDVACEMAGDGTTWGCRRPFRQREPLAWESEFRWGKQRRHSCLACYPALRPRPSSNEPDIRDTCSRGHDHLDQSTEWRGHRNCCCCRWFGPQPRSKTEAGRWTISTVSRLHCSLSLNEPRKVEAGTVALDDSLELTS